MGKLNVFFHIFVLFGQFLLLKVNILTLWASMGDGIMGSNKAKAYLADRRTMMSKKLRCFALVAAMLCGLTACGQGNSDAGSSSGSSAAAETSVIDPETINTGKYEEPVTLTSYFRIATVFLNLFSEEELKSCYYTQQQIEQTNITVEYEWYSPNTAEDAVQKTSMAIASGDIPDFMIVDRAQLALLSKTDLINKDLEPLWDAYASDTLKEWTTAEGDDAWESLRYDGTIIGLPNIGGSIDQGEMVWIRNDWLENLGLPIPTTMDELYDVMLAFKNDDPDGNGQDDTIGMTLHKDFFSGPGTGDALGVFNSFGAYPQIWVEDGNGGIEYGSVTEGAKDALIWLAQAYQDGLIEQDFSSMDSNKAAEASVSGRSGVQWGAMWNHMWPLQSTVDNNNEADWIALPLLSGVEGETAHPQCDIGVNEIFVISAECEHPEAVIKLLNFWAETQLLPNEERAKYMLPDESGTMTFPQHYVMAKTWNPLKNLEQYYHINEVLETGDTSILNGEEMDGYKDVAAYIETGDPSKTGPYKTFGPGHSAYAAIDTYYSNDLYMFNKFTTADTPAMQQKLSTVDDKIIEYYTQVIMGVKSTDDWDTFMSEAESLGLSEITAEANEWYQNK